MSVRWKCGTIVFLAAGVLVFAAGNIGKIAGTITSSNSGNPAIRGAGIVFYSGGARIDSVITDSSGKYSDSLNAGIYSPVKISATGFKSDSDLIALDTSVTVASGSNSILNATLTPANSELGGTLYGGLFLGLNGSPISNASLYLNRRATNVGSASIVFWTVDSTISDSQGRFEFRNLIPGFQANYHVRLIDSALNLDTNSGNTTVGDSQLVTINFDFIPMPIESNPSSQKPLFLQVSPSQLAFIVPSPFSRSNSSATIYRTSGAKVLQSPIGSKGEFEIPIENLGLGEYYLELKDSKNRAVESFHISQ
jgi:hypothetical protein